MNDSTEFILFKNEISIKVIGMKRLQPPLHLLKAFTTTARFSSVSRASEALHLSQSAVSKQISELEQMTGVLLIERVRKRLILSTAGERYKAVLRPILAQLEAATLELITSGDGGGALHVSSLPTFGAKCLIPMLPQFQRAHPHITLHFVPYVQATIFLARTSTAPFCLAMGIGPAQLPTTLRATKWC